MKKYWHTKTLFIQWWKYKWSFKYEHCISCWKVEKPHKWRWLCTSCWDKERDKNPRRKEVKQKARHKWHVTHKPKKPRDEWLPMWPKRFLTEEDKKKYRAEWYQKWKEPIIILNKGRIWERKWIILPKYQWKPIPFDIWPKTKEESYEEYKERMRKYELVKSFIDK